MKVHETLFSEFIRVISFKKYEWSQISTNPERKCTANLTIRTTVGQRSEVRRCRPRPTSSA